MNDRVHPWNKNRSIYKNLQHSSLEFYDTERIFLYFAQFFIETTLLKVNFSRRNYTFIQLEHV